MSMTDKTGLFVTGLVTLALSSHPSKARQHSILTKIHHPTNSYLPTVRAKLLPTEILLDAI